MDSPMWISLFIKRRKQIFIILSKRKTNLHSFFLLISFQFNIRATHGDTFLINCHIFAVLCVGIFQNIWYIIWNTSWAIVDRRIPQNFIRLRKLSFVPYRIWLHYSLFQSTFFQNKELTCKLNVFINKWQF